MMQVVGKDIKVDSNHTVYLDNNKSSSTPMKH